MMPRGAGDGPATAAARHNQRRHDHSTPARILTPWAGVPTPELVAARDRLSRWYREMPPDDPHRNAVGDLIVWAALELAERLAAFVRITHADGCPAYGAALERLAYDAGIVEVRRR